MPYSNVAQALATLSNTPNGPAFCDKVARWFEEHGDSYVASLDSKIGFYRLNRGTDEGARLRLAARLIARLFPALGIAAEADGWNALELESLISKAKRDAPPPPDRAGYYHRGSFWAFSTKDERKWAAAAWSEAKTLIAAGVLVAERVSKKPAAANLLARWFGRGEATAAQVLNNLERLQEAMQDSGSLVGFTYVGPNASKNVTYQEETTEKQATVVIPNEGEWGWVPGQVHSRRVIGLCSKFFNPKHTTLKAIDLHSIAANEYSRMDISRGGAMVHELTHALLKTNDERLSQAGLDVIGQSMAAGIPKASGQVKEKMEGAAKQIKAMAPDTLKAYSGFACKGLARVSSLGALTNADSYRLYCEDAAFYAPRL